MSERSGWPARRVTQRDDEWLGGIAENGRHRLVIRLVGVEEREERARIDDHRAPKPRRCSSARLPDELDLHAERFVDRPRPCVPREE